jgi:hypothetical protein
MGASDLQSLSISLQKGGSEGQVAQGQGSHGVSKPAYLLACTQTRWHACGRAGSIQAHPLCALLIKDMHGQHECRPIHAFAVSNDAGGGRTAGHKGVSP